MRFDQLGFTLPAILSNLATMQRNFIGRFIRPTNIRAFSTARPAYSSWSPGPSPPRLPKEEQELFEQLQEQSTGAFSTPRTPPKINQSPHAEPESEMVAKPAAGSPEAKAEAASLNAKVQQGDELHPNVRRGAKPEFEGETNPQTGEVGGPKNNPLRWGHGGDWSYNGRVTDF